jgi:cytochrome oxidase Cu insertion factor (SCO1/SenC/PrrC family)
VSRRRIPILLVLSVALLLFVVGFVWSLLSGVSSSPTGSSPLESGSGPLPELGPVPPFSLVDQAGEPFTREDLAGAPWLADFIFTTCAGVCPIMSTQMARLQHEIPEDSPLRLVSVSVDPGHDTPEVLREYAARYDADLERWTFLTGDPAAVYRLSIDGFKLAAGEREDWEPGVDDGPFVHSTRMALVDAGGIIRGYYDGTDAAEMDRLRTDLRRLEAGS